MTLSVGAASGNKDATEIWVGTAGGNKQVTEGWVGTASGNKQFYTSASPMTADASPDTQSWTIEAGPDLEKPVGPDYFIFAATLYVTPSGGTGPYTYAWAQLSGLDAGMSDPTASSVSLYNTNGGTCTFNCTVTDHLGATAVSDTVTVS